MRKDSSGSLLVVFWQSCGDLWQSSGSLLVTTRRLPEGGLLVVLWQSSSSLLVTNRRLPEDHQKTARRPPEYHHKTARRPQEDNTEDYEQLKEEYLELREDTKSQPKKNRKKLPKLKMNKNTKKLMRMVNRIIKTSPDDMNITNINLMQYAGALLITNKITPAKPTTISFVDGFFHILVNIHHSDRLANHQKLNIIQK